MLNLHARFLQKTARSVGLTGLFLTLVGCKPSQPAPSASPTPGPFGELIDQGVGRYIGMFTPNEVATSEPGVQTYTFDATDGPMCLRGDPYRMSIRDQPTSNDLFIFLQGGGACWQTFCVAIEEALPGIPLVDVLDPDQPHNPVPDWNLSYLPYCDGSLFAGDIERDDNQDGEADRIHRGLRNLSAALDVTHHEYPTPNRILLAGSSGGAYGTIMATVLVRHLWPGIPIYVFNDAGVGIADPDDPDFLRGLVEEWGAGAFLPESAPDLIDEGHLTPFVGWLLEQDPLLKISAFSSYHDYIIANLFLLIGPDTFNAALREETAKLQDRFPARYKPFHIEGTLHTTLLGEVGGLLGAPDGDMGALEGVVEVGGIDTTVVDDVVVGDWMGWMLDESPRWKPVQE